MHQVRSHQALEVCEDLLLGSPLLRCARRELVHQLTRQDIGQHALPLGMRIVVGDPVDDGVPRPAEVFRGQVVVGERA